MKFVLCDQMASEEKPQGEDFVMNRIRQLKYAVDNLGFPFLMCLFLAIFIWKKVDQLNYKIDRCIRNERAIMQHLKIPVIVAKDEWSED